MANRVTEAEVKEIIIYDDTISLGPFMTLGNQLVTEVCTDSGYSDARLKEIERWLDGHFYTMVDQAIDMDKAKTVSARYQYRIGLFLQQTKQGQTALTADTAGNLAALSKRLEDGKSGEVTISWMGQDYSTADPTD